jgi:hypothetical protein
MYYLARGQKRHVRYGVSDATDINDLYKIWQMLSGDGQERVNIINAPNSLGDVFQTQIFLQTLVGIKTFLIYCTYIWKIEKKITQGYYTYIVLYVHMKNGKENYPRIFDIFLFSHIVQNCMSDNFRKLKIYNVYIV